MLTILHSLFAFLSMPILLVELVRDGPPPLPPPQKQNQGPSVIVKEEFKYDVVPVLFKDFVQQATGQNSQHPMGNQHDQNGDLVVQQTQPSYEEIGRAVPTNAAGSGGRNSRGDAGVSIAGGASASDAGGASTSTSASGAGGAIRRHPLNTMSQRPPRVPSPYARPAPAAVVAHRQQHPLLTIGGGQSSHHPSFTSFPSTTAALQNRLAARPSNCGPHNCAACSEDQFWCHLYGQPTFPGGHCRWRGTHCEFSTDEMPPNCGGSGPEHCQACGNKAWCQHFGPRLYGCGWFDRVAACFYVHNRPTVNNNMNIIA